MPAPPYVLSIFGPDRLSNWDGSDMDAYREKRGRWQQAIVRYLDSFYPGLARRGRRLVLQYRAVGPAISQCARWRGLRVRADAAALAAAAARRSPRTAVPGLYLASAYAGFGGYTGVVQSGGACADMILGES